MKKTIISIIASFMFFSQSSIAADYAMGITANLARVDTSGSETLRDSGNVTNADHEENVIVPEIFFEAYNEAGAFGIAYIPVQEMGSKSRT